MASSAITEKQAKYCVLKVQGVKDIDAVIGAGYSYVSRYQVLRKLNESDKVKEYIRQLKTNAGLLDKANAPKEEYVPSDEVATREDREKFWTEMMLNPQNSGPVRLEASKLLGKAQGDFKENKATEEDKKKSPVLVIPASNPEEWEEYWEKSNKKDGK